MMPLEAFCAEFGVDAAAARHTLARETDAVPWYAEALLGAGGWFSAIAIIVFVIAFFMLVIGVEEPGIEAIIAGLALFGGAVAWRRRQRDGLFARHFAIALAAAGATLAIGGIGPVPQRLSDVESFLLSGPIDQARLEQAAEMPVKLVQSRTRQEYRREVVRGFVMRGLINAVRRAGGDAAVVTPELEASYA